MLPDLESFQFFFLKFKKISLPKTKDLLKIFPKNFGNIIGINKYIVSVNYICITSALNIKWVF